MEIKVQKKYLTLPVNKARSKKKLCFYCNGELVYDLDVHLDNLAPTFTSYVDISRFYGQELTLTVEPQMPLCIGEADEMELQGLYEEPMRPLVHFTVKNGWNNDPNGLCFHNGVYHMFYQYNPCDIHWGNMHWGHAISADLIHWEEQDIKLFPDAYGTEYSGCAYVDHENLSGLGSKEDPPILFYYTAAGGENRLSQGQPYTQRLAYSLDNGNTLIKHPDCILEHIVACNRDPKVVYVAEISSHVMILYLEKGEFALFSSNDLYRWTLFQRLTIRNDGECPNLVRVPIKNNTGHRWVIFGATGIYTVGSFVDGQFVPEQDAYRASTESRWYAGQCFHNADEVIVIDWLRTQAVESRFSQAMGIPCRLELENAYDRLWLTKTPIDALQALAVTDESPTSPLCDDTSLTIPLTQKAYDISLTADYDEENSLTLSLFGQAIAIDMHKNQVSVGKNACTLSLDRKRVSLRIIVDTTSVEIFADGGRFSFAASTFSDYNLMNATLNSHKPLKNATLSLFGLKSIWNKKG